MAIGIAGTLLWPTFLPVSASVTSRIEQMTALLQTTAVLSNERVSLGGTVNVIATQAAEGSTFAFYYRPPHKENWKTAQAYSQNRTAMVTASVAGKYEVCVKTKSPDGKITKQYFSFEAVDDLAVNGSLSAEKVPLGLGVTAAAKASGGNGGYLYSVYQRKKGASAWTSVLKDSKSGKAVINPFTAGVYEVCIKVKDSTNILRKEYFSFEVVDFSAEVKLGSGQIRPGAVQTISASVSEGAAVCSYQFYFKNPTDTNWRKIQNESGGRTVSFRPSKTGTYEVCVKAINAAENVRKAYASFLVSKTLTVSHTLSETSVECGGALVVTPSSAGGTGKVQYAVYYTTKELYEAGANQWTAALKYGQTGNAVIRPDKIGEYVVVTKAKDETGTVKKTAYTSFRVVEKLTAAGRFKGSSTVYTNAGITFIAEAAGGTAPYTYAVKVREKNTAEWHLVRDFSTDSQCSLKRSQMGHYTLSSKHNFELMVLVRDQDGQTAQAIYPFTVTDREEYELPLV